MQNILLEEGMNAPDFKLVGSDKKEHKLSDYINKKVILYFYPKDNTPGCSREAQDFKESIKDFTDNNTVIIGISRDSLKSHDKFIEKYDLPFLLLSDEDEVVCNLYGVLKEKNMFGKKCFGLWGKIIKSYFYILNVWVIIKPLFNPIYSFSFIL